MAAEKPKKIRLSKAQRRCLFAVGAFGQIKRFGSWGSRFQFRVRWKLEEEGLTTIDTGNLLKLYGLTPAGEKRFKEEFGEPCPEHEWWSIPKPFDREHRECETCKAVHLRVAGYELR